MKIIDKEDGLFEVQLGKHLLTYTERPHIVSGLFLVSEDNTQLYTILGDIVQLPEGAVIVDVINFWLLYELQGCLYISYLENNGLTFYLNAEMSIQTYGLLTSRGCIVKKNDEWITYVYDFDIIRDYRDPNTPNEDISMEDLIKVGFSLEYIEYLFNKHIELSTEIKELRMQADTLLYNQIMELVELSKLYSPKELSQGLDFPEYMVKKLIVFSSYYKQIEEKKNNE